MIFPFSKRPSDSSNEDTVGKLDRCLADRAFRLNVGLNLASDLGQIEGCLVVTSGRGKYLRLRYATAASEAVPGDIREGLSEALTKQASLGELQPFLHDLAAVQAEVVQQLKIKAGKVVDRILTVSVTDPGYWTTDFDGHPIYFALNDANRLAETTGITVVDSFPARDLAVGGSGTRIECLPLWLAFADRSSRVATENRLIIQLEKTTTVFALPASDGLDADVPAVTVTESAGLGLVESLVNRIYEGGAGSTGLPQLVRDAYAMGQVNGELLDRWEQSDAQQMSGRIADWVQFATGRAQSEHLPPECLIRSALAVIAASALHRTTSPPERVILFCEDQFQGVAINLFDQSIDAAVVESGAKLPEINGCSPHALTAALLGMMNIDQLPANIPWITGADSQRILGRLTPGRPSNWRQLVLDMADYCPPAMKLKDAI